jgi:hypothetical protein
MSRTNSNPVYIWNGFRNLNVIKADKEMISEVQSADLGAATSVGGQSLSRIM